MTENRPRPGFRLDRLEVLNWGTFDRRVWTLQCNGENALLTGDIGSGKSTLVDALTTLLVPPRAITYNKAAGADSRERTLRSYVLGHHRMEREEGGTAKPVSLRDVSSYSVILGCFVSEDLSQSVTLAQVFWWKEPQGQPARFYVVADRGLSIADTFGDFGSEMEGLRKRLRKLDGVDLHDAFPAYGSALRRRFGLDSEQALMLFYQTVSMKSVGSLTDFVREHMLEPFPVDERIAALLAHFDDLTRAHEVVLRTKEQISRLTPLVAECVKHRSMGERVAELESLRDALRAWFARLKGDLLKQMTAELELVGRALVEQATAVADHLNGQRRHHEELVVSIRENGGERLQQISTLLDDRRRVRDRRNEKANKYHELANALGLPVVANVDDFVANEARLDQHRTQAVEGQADAQNRLTEAMVEVRQLTEKYDQLQLELGSLRSRRSNIPAERVSIRRRLCDALGVSEDTIPFAGELVQVRQGARDWEGAIERVLHGFATSLLVPDAHYTTVAAFVDSTYLRGRVVYLRVRDTRYAAPHIREPGLLLDKVEIRVDSPMSSWLEMHMASRFDYVCCESLDDLRRVTKGFTRAGQIKSSLERHEKDDRSSIDDRARYVLGWSNELKIAALEKQAAAIAAKGQAALQRQTAADQERQAREKLLGVVGQLGMFDRFEEMDWRTVALEIERLEKERADLESSSDKLKTLEAQRLVVAASIVESEGRDREIAKDQGILHERLTEGRRLLAESEAIVLAERPIDGLLGRLAEARQEALGSREITVETSEARQQELRRYLQGKIDEEAKRREKLGNLITAAMSAYRAAYPNETRDVDASVSAASEFEGMLEQLTTDDLPRFEAKFKSLLNENTIREIANFQSQLNRERHTIGERIARINASLRDIDYNPGRFIELLAEPSTDVDIREFQQQLRACTEGSLTGSDEDEYSERKFLQVSRIIERFRGRDENADLDRAWTQKVTDVRNWFGFSASEKWREDGREHEHYASSGGKSGGQKEKLAYTVLAASLAYQFGLGSQAARSRSFRFVLIDEAFGRGSDESASFGLTLFGQLNLQLLVVTPLQKIHVIEPFVSGVGFVHNADGRGSVLRNLTIEEYRAERALRLERPAAVPA